MRLLLYTVVSSVHLAGNIPMTAGRSQIAIALMGLVGVLTTGVLSNWDKLFSHVVTASYQGYKPTGDFETELRYHFEITGERKNSENQTRQTLDAMRSLLIAKHPDDAKEINQVMEAVLEIVPKFEDSVALSLPIYTKYFTVAELQELNKFYSTDIMQQMVKKDPLIQQEYAPIFAKAMLEYQEKLNALLEKKTVSDKPSQKPPNDH
jgi:hypothetical protein